MRDKDTRRSRLRTLIDERFDGVAARLATTLDMKPPQLHRWLSGRQGISEDSARAIERKIGLSRGWLDTDDTAQNALPHHPDGTMATTRSDVTVKSPDDAFYERSIPPLPLHDLPIITAEQIMREATPKGRFIWIAEDDHMASGPMPSPRGHHVLIDPTAQHLHEDMVLAIVAGHRPMLRRYTEDGDMAYLVTATGALPSRLVTDDILIIGVAITSFPPPIERPPKSKKG